MALSIGFRIFSFLPSCYSSYGALNFYPGGTDSHCSCQPLLDAHISVTTRARERCSACLWPIRALGVAKGVYVLINAVVEKRINDAQQLPYSDCQNKVREQRTSGC